MHTAMYEDHPEVGCVLHTHSPYATAYAVAQRRIGCWIEAMAMFGLADGVPVAGYGPRGSAEAVANIRGAVIPGVPAVLLANHGVLVFHRTPDLAILTGSVVEEAAQAGLSSQGLGGPVEIPPELRAAALQRAMAFDSRGSVHAESLRSPPSPVPAVAARRCRSPTAPTSTPVSQKRGGSGRCGGSGQLLRLSHSPPRPSVNPQFAAGTWRDVRIVSPDRGRYVSNIRLKAFGKSCDSPDCCPIPPYKPYLPR